MHDGYPLPRELTPRARGDKFTPEEFTPEELRGACWKAGEGLGREDAGEARFHPAAEMVEMWRGLDLPAWVAPYALRDARLGYHRGYDEALVSGELPEEQVERAARARWGEGWREKLEAALSRAAR